METLIKKAVKSSSILSENVYSATFVCLDKQKIEELFKREFDLHEKLKQRDRRIKALKEKATKSPSKEKQQELASLNAKAKECNVFIDYR